jgi:hypothetical protein
MSHLRHDTTVTYSTSALGHLCLVVFLACPTWQMRSRTLEMRKRRGLYMGPITDEIVAVG